MSVFFQDKRKQDKAMSAFPTANMDSEATANVVIDDSVRSTDRKPSSGPTGTASGKVLKARNGRGSGAELPGGQDRSSDTSFYMFQTSVTTWFQRCSVKP